MSRNCSLAVNKCCLFKTILILSLFSLTRSCLDVTVDKVVCQKTSTNNQRSFLSSRGRFSWCHTLVARGRSRVHLWYQITCVYHVYKASSEVWRKHYILYTCCFRLACIECPWGSTQFAEIDCTTLGSMYLHKDLYWSALFSDNDWLFKSRLGVMHLCTT